MLDIYSWCMFIHFVKIRGVGGLEEEEDAIYHRFSISILLSVKSNMYLIHLKQHMVFVTAHSRKATGWIIQAVGCQGTSHSIYWKKLQMASQMSANLVVVCLEKSIW